MKDELKKTEGALSEESSWKEPKRLKELRKRKSAIEDIILPFESLTERFNYLKESSIVLDEEGGELFLDEIGKGILSLKRDIEEIETRHLLSGDFDRSNAIITIHPGAGGTESQDWASMLLRMYLRWAERNGFETQIIDLQPGEEAGIKDATITIKGLYAYGLLKVEAGVHRLVRISPFDANKRRHTSFSAVLVSPEIEDDIDVEMRQEDIKIDTFRASGAGGQHVNKTSSAVRLTHIPTGIVVSCQNERSQHRNKETALRILKARLYDMKAKEQESKIDNMVGDKKGIAWGSQIRSYVLQPYRLVKDHRTGLEKGDVDSVLDGEIEDFIKEALKISKREPAKK